MSQPIIEVRNLSKRYQLGAIGATSLREETSRLWSRLRGAPSPDPKEFWALRDVSFDIFPGEVVGVIGRNGAGKSTLLKILSRITEPTAGTARLRGRVASLLEVGTGFHPELSGRENVFLNGAILGMSRAEVARKFDEIVAFAEVDRFIDTPVKRYSSGMYVRLAFAVAAHLEPEILIVDEVLAVGDAAFQAKCLGKLENIARNERRTVLLVSHNMVSMQQLCNRIIRLDRGTLGGDGPPLEEIRAYVSSRSRSTERIGDLTSLSRTDDLRGDAILQTVELETALGSPAWKHPFAERLRLKFTALLKRPLPMCELGLGLFNLHGQEIVSTLSSWQGELGPLPAGRHEFTVDYGCLELAPGNYHFGVGLKSDRGLEDYLPEAFEMEVVPSATSLRPNLANIRGAIAHSAVFSTRQL